MAQITMEGLGKIYPDGTRAVGDVDLTIKDGEFLVLVGPSGCGKSTILRMIAGLEEISEGTMYIGDRWSTTCSRRTATSRWCSRTTRCIRTCRCSTTWRSG